MGQHQAFCTRRTLEQAAGLRVYSEGVRPGDRLTIEFPNYARSGATVTAVSKDRLSLDFGGERCDLRPWLHGDESIEDGWTGPVSDWIVSTKA